MMTETRSADAWRIAGRGRRQSRPASVPIGGTGVWLVAAAVLALAAPAAVAPVPASAQTKVATKGKAAAKSDSGAPSSSDGGLKTRVEQLEEQLVDMQVVIGTLESLARQGASTSPAAAPRPATAGAGLGAGDQARLDSMETQIRALTQQLERLAEEVRQRRSDAAPMPSGAPPIAPRTATVPSQFGSTSVTSGGDPIGSLISGGAPPAAVPVPVAQAPLQAVAAAPDAAANPKEAYETAYGYLLQQDYGAAEAAFDDFLKKYPSDALAGNAQYWLGESFFVRGQYKQAAGAFLKGYQTYGKSAKAPDSLLKLAMSLDRLGQKDAACSSYGELATRFPGAAPHIKTRAQSERARLSCS